MALEEKGWTLSAKKDNAVPYPDFDAMWTRIQEDSSMTAAISGKGVRFKKSIVITSVAALCLATPAFAFNWDLSGLFNGRKGIQTALNEGLGQKLNQSVTLSGVNITLEHALVDENRTVILYKMDPGAAAGDHWYFEKVRLIDKKGKEIEGTNQLSPNYEAGVVYGFFETDWVPAGATEHVDFTFSGLRSIEQVFSPLELNMENAALQRFPIQQDGIASIVVQPFVLEKDELLFSSAVSFSNKEASKTAYPSLAIKRNNELIIAKHSALGAPGPNQEFLMKQTYAKQDVTRDDVTFWLQYNRDESITDGKWSFSLELDKRSMKAGTVKTELDARFGPDGAYRFVSMLVTPTQIRIRSKHDEPYMMYPFMDYELKIDDTRLRGGQFHVENSKHDNEFRFERPPGLEITKDTPVSIIGTYEVIKHPGGNIPIELKNISEEKQTMTTTVGGFPVTWTYYKKDNDVYVESGSEDRSFGGVNQTYRLSEKGQIPSEPVTNGFYGDGNNSLIEKYKNYTNKDLTIYIYYYTTEQPDKQIEIPLLSVE